VTNAGERRVHEPVEGERTVDISVIVPTHDRRPLLERKLRALEGETVAFEVIVVADACRDDTEAFLAGYSPPYPFRWTTSPGTHAAFARNRGADWARGRVLLFTDDDVISRPGWLSGNLAAHDGPRVVGLSRQVLPEHLTMGAALSGPVWWWNVNGRSVSLTAELFHAVGGYDPSFSTYGGEDPDLGYRLLRAGARFVYLPNATAEHWDEAYLEDLEAKARSAGRAHVRVWRKHGDARIAWALGIHPALAAAKRLVLNGVVGSVVQHPRYRYERAYLEGALAARSEEADA
jgi:GT2 family glycosyltransferase